MNKMPALLFTATVVSLLAAGCQQPAPEVVTTPGSTTIVHDKAPASSPAPKVTINNPTPPATHTDTTTSSTTTPSTDPSTPDTTTTTKSTTTTTG